MSESPHASTYLTIAQVAESLSCSPDSIRRLIARGELRAYRFGRLIRVAASDVGRAGRPITRPRPELSEVPEVSATEVATAGRHPGEAWQDWAHRRAAG